MLQHIDSWTDLSESIRESIRKALGPPLRAALGPLDAWLNSLPLWVGRACAVGLFVTAGVWLLCLKREFVYVYLGAPDQATWRDLRIWAALALLPYIVLYLVFK